MADKNVSFVVVVRDLASKAFDAIRERIRAGTLPAAKDLEGALKNVDAASQKAGRDGSENMLRLADATHRVAYEAHQAATSFATRGRGSLDAFMAAQKNAAIVPERISALEPRVRRADVSDPATVARIQKEIAAIRELGKATGATEVEMERLRAVEKKFDDRLERQMRADVKAIKDKTGALRDMQPPIPPLTNLMDGLIAKAGAVLVAFMSWQALKKTVGFIYETTAEFQKLLTMLEAFEQTKTGARAIFDDLRSLAVELPGSLQNLTEAYITLRGAGVRPTLSDMRNLGNFAAATGKDIGQVAEAIRAAQAGYVIRLRSLNIMAHKDGTEIVAQYNGVTTRIKATAQAVTQYITEIGRTRFAGAAEKQMETLNGQMDKFKDSLANVAFQIGEAGWAEMFLDALKQLSALTDALDKNRGSVEYFAKGIATTIVFVASFFKTAILGFGTVASFVVNSTGAIIANVLGMITNFVAKAASLFGMNTQYMERLTKELYNTTTTLMGKAKANLEEMDASGRRFLDSTGGMLSAWGNIAAFGKDMTDAQGRAIHDLGQTIDDNAKVLANSGFKNKDAMRAMVEIDKLLIERIKAHREELRQEGKKDDEYIRRMISLRNTVQTRSGPVPNTEPPEKTPKIGKVETDRLTLIKELVEEESLRTRGLEMLEREHTRINTELSKGNLTMERELALRKELHQVEEIEKAVWDARFKVVRAELLMQEQRTDAIHTLEFMERGLRKAMEDTTRSVDARIDAYERLKQVQEELAKSRPVYDDSAEAAKDRKRLDKQFDRDINPLPRLEGIGSLGDREMKKTDPGMQEAADSIDKVVEKMKEFRESQTLIDELGMRFSAMGARIKESLAPMETLNAVIADMAVNAFAALGDAVETAMANMISGSRGAAKAFRDAFLSAIADVARAEGMKNLAAALEAIGHGIMGRLNGFAAAAKYTAAAVAYFAVAGVAKGMTSGGGGGGGGGSSSTSRDGLQNAAKGSVTIYMPDGSSVFDPSDPRVVEGWRHMFEDLTDREVIVTTRKR